MKLCTGWLVITVAGKGFGQPLNPWVDNGIALHGWAKSGANGHPSLFHPTKADYFPIDDTLHGTSSNQSSRTWQIRGNFATDFNRIFSVPKGFILTECKNALVHFMPHERGFVQCHLSMTQCQHKGQMGGKPPRFVHGSAIAGFDLGWRSFQHDIINALPHAGMAILHPAVAGNHNLTVLCAPLVCRILSRNKNLTLSRVDFQKGGVLCVENLIWAIVNHRPSLVPSFSNADAVSDTSITVAKSASTFPEPYNTTSDTVTHGAFTSLLNPFKVSIGIDPGKPPEKLLIYVSRFVSAGNRRIIDEKNVARAMQSVAVAHKFEFFIWNKTTGSIEEDAKIWSRARVVAGLHGGGLTNIAFLHPSASVIEITPQPSGCVRLCFAAIAFSLNIKYHAFAPSESTAFTCADYRNRRRIQLNGKAIARYVTSVLESASTEDIQ